jgi:hypothetical protein
MSALEKALQSIQQDADTKMEELCQELYQGLVDELRVIYPKRKIEVVFGMGTVVVKGFGNTRFSDTYGNLDSKYDMYQPWYDSLPEGHPLKSLILLTSEAVYANGYNICCEDIK